MKFSILLALLPVALASPIAATSPEAPASDLAARYDLPKPCPAYYACIEEKGDEHCTTCICNRGAWACNL
ncbi:hypothetical protein ACSS6W_009760 [Trichoderma asperelloides]|nr:hypothetical protein LI328DRAFT_171781 [Trichoderma asperelloides]